MPQPEIRLHSHFRGLHPSPERSYRTLVDELTERTFSQEPWLDLIRAGLRQPCLGAADDDAALIRRRLDALCRLPAEAVVRAGLQRLVALVPPATPFVECHLWPGRALDRGGGMSFAPGKILVGLPISADWRLRVQRSCAHEYSHAVRMALFPQDERHSFGPAPGYTVLESLVLEGLAETLADELYPAPGLRPAPPPAEAVRAWWQAVSPHPGERGLAAYVQYVLGAGTKGLPAGIGYFVGEDLVCRHLAETHQTAVSLQRAPADAILRRTGPFPPPTR